jgi:DNA-nicking Smr family endonuclease
MSRRADPDAAVWRQAMRGVLPLTPRARPLAGPTLFSAEPPKARPVASTVPPSALPPLAVDRFAGIDRASAERLKRGRQPIEGRLDLHGMTQDEAHRALARFIHASRAEGKRCILVITGRGAPKGPQGGGGGVLRSAVPRWFAEPAFRPHLLAIAAAQPRDGGAGALYVMLRRNPTLKATAADR